MEELQLNVSHGTTENENISNNLSSSMTGSRPWYSGCRSPECHNQRANFQQRIHRVDRPRQAQSCLLRDDLLKLAVGKTVLQLQVWLMDI